MQRRSGAALAVLCTSLTVGSCVFPTERDDAVRVTVDPLPVLLRGEDTYATARAYASGSQQLANVAFVWSSDAESIATVDATGHIVGIKSGTTIIRARAANFDKRGVSGQTPLRVSAPLEIDSIRPDSVRYGEIVDIYGVGLLDTLGVGLSVGEGGLIRRPFSDTTFANGASMVRYWVPPPAQTAPLFYIGAGVFGFSLDTVRVLRRDLYEPNELSPTAIDLEAARPFPGTILDVVLFANPALAFEPLPRDVVQGVDWYRLDQTTQRDLSIIVSSDVLGTFQTFLTDQFTFQASDTSYHIGPDSWTFGPQSHACHGAAFAPKEAPAESTIVALRNFPVGSLHAIAVYAQPGRYALTVLEDYVIAGKGIQRDSHEEDDYCNAVDPPRLPATLPFRDNALTIDNAHDVDWFRFTEPGSGGPVHVRTASLPFGAADSSDIDLYILDVPAPGDTLMTERDRATTAGSTEDVRVSLAPGDYYAVVVDFAGVPTRYAICIGKDPSCDLFPAPPAVGLQASGSRRARLEAEITRRHARLAPLRSGRSR